jgi:hypothetical protein
MSEKSIVDVGKFLQKYGLKIGENPAFGVVSNVHTKGSYHYTPGGSAIDVTDWRPDMAPAYEGGPSKSWKQRTGELSWRAKKLGVFTEALGPGDPGHSEHVHLALAKNAPISEQQLEWLATGRYKTPEGKLSSSLPTSYASGQSLPATTQPAQPQTAQQGAGNTIVLVPGMPNQPKSSEDYLTDFLSKNFTKTSTGNTTSQIDPIAALRQAFNTPSTFE